MTRKRKSVRPKNIARKLPLIDTLAKRHDLAWQHLLSVSLTFPSEKEAAEFLEAVKAAKGKR